jgi:hypothetical protein
MAAKMSKNVTTAGPEARDGRKKKHKCFRCGTVSRNEKRQTSMDERRKRRKEYRSWKKGYYHLCTDGWKGGLLFHDEGEYVNAVNSISLLDLKYPVKVHFYEVMRSHLHLIVSGLGTHCVDSFDYLKERVGRRLRKDGRPPLPSDYDFRLIPIENEDQMRDNLVYVAMNAPKVMDILPGGYLWGSALMVYSDLSRLFETVRAGDLSDRELERMFGTHLPIPPDRLIHSGLGMVLPQSFVDIGVFYKLFPKAKEFLIALVKDYEAYIRVARQIGEDVDFSLEEALDIVKLELDKLNLSLDKMSAEQKCRLAVELNRKYQLKADVLSSALLVPERIIAQKLYAERPKNKR